MSKINFPMQFQGKMNKSKYFEGWYYKLVSKNQNMSFVFIPGISITKNDKHAFIQVFTSNHKDEVIKTKYIRYDVDLFSYDDSKNILTLGKCLFGLDKVIIDINEEDLNIKAGIQISERKDINRTIISPSIMGFFRYIPKMECYHGIVSMSHYLEGNIKINQESYTLDGGKGYIEKDWGTSFPKSYVWIQSNHFKEEDTTFMLSYAKIPFLGLTFNGLIANLIVDGLEYRFATYNFSKVKNIQHDEKTVQITIKKGKYLLKVKAENEIAVHLVSPKNGDMSESIKEGLSGEVTIELYKRKNLVYKDVGSVAGLEIMLD